MAERARSRTVLHLALGGTIGCVRTAAGLAPRLGPKDLLRRARVPARTVVEGVDFLQRTVVFPRDWVALSRRIARALDRYDGFVVTLGTDTLAYVAAALTITLRNLGKPVVLTGAMIPIRDARTDARRNLSDALRVASTPGIGGVLVVFHGEILAGGSVSKVRSTDVDAFESINELALGRSSANGIAWRREPVVSARGARGAALEPKARFDTRVATCKLTPQVDAAFVEGVAKYHGIVVEGYGDGNVPVELVPALSRLARRRIVVLASHCLHGAVRHRYEGGRALIRAGALSAGAATKEAALVRLMWALGQGRDRIHARRLFSAL